MIACALACSHASVGAQPHTDAVLAFILARCRPMEAGTGPAGTGPAGIGRPARADGRQPKAVAPAPGSSRRALPPAALPSEHAEAMPSATAEVHAEAVMADSLDAPVGAQLDGK